MNPARGPWAAGSGQVVSPEDAGDGRVLEDRVDRGRDQRRHGEHLDLVDQTLLR